MLWRTPWLRQRLALIGFAGWDAISLYLGYNVTYLTRIGRWEGLTPGLLVTGTIWLGISYLIGRYSPTEERDKSPRVTQLGKTIVVAAAVIVLFVGHSWIYQVVDAQTRFRGFLIPMVTVVFILSAIGKEIFSRFDSRRRNWLILGNKEELEAIGRELEATDENLRQRTRLLETFEIVDRLRDYKDCYTGIATGSLELRSKEETRELIESREQGMFLVPLMSWCEEELQRIPPDLINSEWLVQAEGFSLRKGGYSWRVKRFIDVVGAGLLIALTAPVVMLCAILIWLEDHGPVFYTQVRTGLYGRGIKIWKLRSMRVNAEAGGVQWATKNDPRVTRIGKIMRTSRIDELPQLFSVLSGDLSLIGPRPERPEIEMELEREIPYYRLRKWIRPGLSGWAQVCYPYGASTYDSKMKLSYDIYYLRNANLLLDVLILLKTIKLVVRGTGAVPKD